MKPQDRAFASPMMQLRDVPVGTYINWAFNGWSGKARVTMQLVGTTYVEWYEPTVIRTRDKEVHTKRRHSMGFAPSAPVTLWSNP